MDLRDLSRIATDLALSTVRLPVAPAARAVGLQSTVDRLDGRARLAVGAAINDPKLKADGRVLRAPGYRKPQRTAPATRPSAATRRRPGFVLVHQSPPYKVPASAVQFSVAPSTDKVAVS